MKNWRFVGIDDSFDDRRCCLVGCVTSGPYVEGFMYAEVSIDGLDSTEKIVKMVTKSKFKEQLKCIFLSGITFGGFNVADIQKINETTGIPVIVVLRKMPNMNEFFSAVENLADHEIRKEIIKKAGEITKINEIFVQLAGIKIDEARELLKAATFKGKIPEALRIAHLIATAIIHGESRGRV
jgi:hypothetical protein